MATTKSAYDPTYHRDGTVTYWDVLAQVWNRASAYDLARDAATMSSQDDTFRRRVTRMAAK